MGNPESQCFFSLQPGAEKLKVANFETRTQTQDRFSHKEIFMPQSWTVWSNTNQNGSEVGPFFCSYPCSGLIVSEQVGHGIVNFKLGFFYPDGAEGWTGWITENMGGSERQPIRCPTGKFASGIKVREQTGKGLVNARLIDSDGNDTCWATDNHDGSENSPLKIPQGNAVTGMVAREQAGYEIINVKLHYQPV